MQALLQEKSLPMTVPLVISDTPGAPVLMRAKEQNIPTFCQAVGSRKQQDYDQHLVEVIRAHAPDIIFMMGYMRIVSSLFVSTFRGKLLNMHPSLLPKYAGLKDIQAHKAVLKKGDTQTGCTLHHVTEVVDSGKTVLQLACNVRQDDTVQTLKQRVQSLEHRAWKWVIQHWSSECP